jgi:hypothetical protein
MNDFERIKELLNNSDLLPRAIKKILYDPYDHYHDFVKDQDEIYSIYKIRLTLFESKQKRIPTGLKDLIANLETNKYALVRVHGMRYKDQWIIAFTNESISTLIGVVLLNKEEEETGNGNII